jgi:hypothetical protein
MFYQSELLLVLVLVLVLNETRRHSDSVVLRDQTRKSPSMTTN